MVVNRKQPAAPVPLIQSRSASQQPTIMRKKHSKPTPANGINNSHKPDEHAPSKIPAQKSEPRPRKRSLRDKLFFWSLTLFTLYSFLICSPYTALPQNSQSHLTCRAETNYKTYILEPFILPPLRHSVSFTQSVAKPYISQANTYLEPYLAPVKQATSIVKPYVIQIVTTTKRVWKGTLIPLYKNTLKPYYRSAILPRYKLYLRPLVAHLQRYYAYYISNPIHIQSNRIQLYLSTLYTTHIHSYISHLQPHIHRLISTLHTAWLSSVDFYVTHIYPTLLSAWIRAQPHLFCAFNKTKTISLNAVAGTAKHLKGLAKQVGTQRRTYVDPHIRKIWDKVEENATAKMTTAVDISFEEESTESATITLDKTPATNTKESAPIDVPVPEEAAQDVLAKSTSSPSPSSSPSPLPTASIHQEAQSVISVAEASAHNASTVLYELSREAEVIATDAAPSGTVENSQPEPIPTEVVQAETEAKEETFTEPATSASAQEDLAESTVEASLGGATTPSTSAAAGGVIGVGATSPSQPTVAVAAEDDLDNFLRDIGIDISSSSPSPTPSQPSEVDEAASLTASISAEEAESSRLAAIASKRLAIVARHETYEADLQSSIKTSTSQVIEKLNEMREAKKAELMGMIEGEEGLIGRLASSGEKLMTGLEVYLKKCQERSGTWKVGNESDSEKRTGTAQDEQTRLESVIEKVEIKFLDVVNKLQEQVNGWYLGAIEREQEKISTITVEIKNMAEQAQANLGLDYAWLEDVSYVDWQRYHDLARAFENFEQTANAIQDGTSLDPPSPPNSIKPAINALQEELQTVVLGFHVALKQVKDTIPDLFSVYVPGDEEDTVRIQPIDPDKETRREEGFDTSKLIIGKSKEQIEQALGGVPLVVHEEL